MTRIPKRGRRRRDDDGAILVLYALMMVAMLTMMAVVIDLGAVRNDRRRDRNAADAAATAGALDLSVGRKEACKTVWKYAVRNLGFTPTADICPNLLDLPCIPANAASVTQEINGYTIEFTNPVPNTHALMRAEKPGGDITQAPSAVADGAPCDRIGVEIRYTRDSLWGKVAGNRQNTTRVHSVAVDDEGTPDDPAALLILDQTGCDALKTSGSGSLEVDYTVSAAGVQSPGIIALDSDASAPGNPIPGCNNSNNHVIEASDNSNNFIRANPTPSGSPGRIKSFAMSGTNFARAYHPSDVASSPLRLSPTPSARSTRITRAPVDHRYNCKVANGCPDAPNPYIDQLVATLDGSGGTAPSGYRIYPDDVVSPPAGYSETPQPDAACSMPSSVPDINVPVGNWFVDCDSGLVVSNRLTFLGGDVVTRAGVSVGSGSGILTFNAAGATPGNNGVLFMRSGNLDKNGQGQLLMPLVTVYQAAGRINIGAGTGALTWIAPETGEFDDLALWSEFGDPPTSPAAASEQRLGGQANLTIEGVLFTPNAQFIFSGQTTVNQTKAQFIAKRLDVGGLGTLKMKPDPDRVVQLPLRGVHLIR